jgi:excisionase family DNA binding protein
LKAETIENKMELFPTKEAARRLGITPSTLRDLVRRKVIGVFRVGGRLMFNQWVLDLYMASVYEPQQ